MTSLVQLTVDRNDLKQCKLVEKPLPSAVELADGALLVKVDRFAFTANNITYALLGDELKYWDLFPAPEGFGIIPVWGFGEVMESRHSDIAAGEVLFGYFPMASHVVIEAHNVKKSGLSDGAAHRQQVSPVYNTYARVTGDPVFTGLQGDYQALMRPLFMLSFLVDDFLAENDFFGARTVILSSASSKTAFGLAWLLSTTRTQVRAVGLTSAGNADFVRSLDCYNEVVTYDAIEKIDAREPVAFIDMAGSGGITARLHRHFGALMKHSARVGLTHQNASAGSEALPGAKPVWFFAPDQIRKRTVDWGPGVIQQRIGKIWPEFTAAMGPKLEVRTDRGPKAVQRIYLETLEGPTRPEQAHMLALSA